MYQVSYETKHQFSQDVYLISLNLLCWFILKKSKKYI